MREFPDPALHLRNKICNAHHQGSHCPCKLRNHTEHHQYNHPNRQYDRKEQTYRSCQFSNCLIFFFYSSENFLFKSSLARWSQMRSLRQVQREIRSPYYFQHVEHHIKLPQCDHKKCCKHNKFPDFFTDILLISTVILLFFLISCVSI